LDLFLEVAHRISRTERSRTSNKVNHLNDSESFSLTQDGPTDDSNVIDRSIISLTQFTPAESSIEFEDFVPLSPALVNEQFSSSEMNDDQSFISTWNGLFTSTPALRARNDVNADLSRQEPTALVQEVSNYHKRLNGYSIGLHFSYL
jgi:hypothetical protein